MKRLTLLLAALLLSLPAFGQATTLYSNSSSVGIGTTSPVVSLDIGQKTDALALPSGTTAQRPGSPMAGELRYNQTTSGIEGYYGSAWNAIPGVSNFRIRLTANKTFYLSTTGSDSNDCLTSGTPCATLNYVWNLIAANYDLAGFSAAIQLADGTYTSGLNAILPALGGTIAILGNSTTPSNVVISVTSSSPACLTAAAPGVLLYVANLEVTATGGSAGIAASEGGTALIGSGIIFGSVDASSGSQINAQNGGNVFIENSYSIVGGGAFHLYAADGSLIRVVNNITVTLTGTPAFGQEFASSADNSRVILAGTTYSGSATGVRYLVTLNAVLNTATGNTSSLPGNAAGSTVTGGQYN